MKMLVKNFVDKNVYELARERVREMFDRFDTVSVMFSGGKDSTVVLELCLEESLRLKRPALDVVHFDEEAIHPPTVEYVERTRHRPGVAMRWLCWPVRHRNACSRLNPYWFPWAPEDEAKWCRPLPPNVDRNFPASWANPANRLTIADLHPLLYPPEWGTIGVALGIRAAESLRRYQSVSRREHDNWISLDSHTEGQTALDAAGVPKRPGIYKCKPVYDMSAVDVWTASATGEWDYNRTYDLYSAIGQTAHEQRVCPPFGEEPLRALWSYAVCFPELWEKMVDRVPGANTAARYSRSPMYGHGADDMGKPPEGCTWQDMVVGELQKWPPDQRKEIAERLQREIAKHNRASGNAKIADSKSEGGLSWEFMYQVARRGDTKGRKQISKRVTDSADLEQLRANLIQRMENNPEEASAYNKSKLARLDHDIAKRQEKAKAKERT